MSLGARGKSNVIECDSRTITRVCRRSSMAAVDSMQFCADLLSEMLEESAPCTKNLHLKLIAIEWRKMIVTDARDVYDKLSTEKGGLPHTEGADIGDCHHSRIAGQLRRSDTLDRGRKYDHEWSDERSQGVKAAPGSSAPEW